MGLPSISQLHSSHWGGCQRSAEMSLCATSTVLWANRGTVYTGTWTFGFIKQKTVCRTGWLLSQHSRKELTSSITGHHTDTSGGRGRIRHTLCGQSKGEYSRNQEQNLPHLCSAQSNSLNTKTRHSCYLIALIFRTIKMLSSKDRVKKSKDYLD